MVKSNSASQTVDKNNQNSSNQKNSFEISINDFLPIDTLLHGKTEVGLIKKSQANLKEKELDLSEVLQEDGDEKEKIASLHDSFEHVNIDSLDNSELLQE
jgi:hypothetical protein